MFMPYPGDPKRAVGWLTDQFSSLSNGTHVGMYLNPSDSCTRLPESIKPLIMSKERYEVRVALCRYGLPYSFEVTPPTVDKLPPMFQVPIGQNIADVIAEHASQALEPVNAKRKYTCSFLGNARLGIAPRAKAVHFIEANPQWNCHLDTSVHWVSDRVYKNQTLAKIVTENYVHVTLNSDFALCPAGGNVESYRIYETVELGSIPILKRNETRITIGKRDHQCTTSYPFLHEFNAPFVWLDSWDQLPQVMQALMQETPEQIYQRRCALIVYLHAASDLLLFRVEVVKWYAYFKREMRQRFVQMLQLLR